jgi:hypothetical protein
MNILLTPVSSSHAASYTFTRLDAPGSLETFVNGINDRGQIVGWYSNSSDNWLWHGFLATRLRQ